MFNVYVQLVGDDRPRAPVMTDREGRMGVLGSSPLQLERELALGPNDLGRVVEAVMKDSRVVAVAIYPARQRRAA